MPGECGSPICSTAALPRLGGIATRHNRFHIHWGALVYLCLEKSVQERVKAGHIAMVIMSVASNKKSLRCFITWQPHINSHSETRVVGGGLLGGSGADPGGGIVNIGGE